MSLRVRVLFQPRDLWIGVFWRRDAMKAPVWRWQVYLCLLPCFPILFEWLRPYRLARR